MSAPPPRQHAVASKLAQLLSEVLITHAPHTAKIGAEESRRQVDDWLEGWEQHTVGFVKPVLQMILDNADPPPAIRQLIEEAMDPGAQFSATLVQIFLWGIISSIISTSVQPFLVGVSKDLSAAAVAAGITRPVDPSILATAAGRGLVLGGPATVTVPQASIDEAAKSGVGEDELNLQASLVGLPPSPEQLLELMRRGIIDSDAVGTGLREGDFRDDWITRFLQLSHAWLSPLDFVRAAVQGQMSYADAEAWAYSTGLDTTTALPLDTGSGEATPDMFGLAFSIAGRPPGPEEAGRMANRGIIPWTGTGPDAVSFESVIAESDVKIKYADALRQLQVYVPPPRTVGTLLEHGAINADQATALWVAGGVPAELAAGYLYMTQQEHIGQDKLLAKGDITTAYFDQIITHEQATQSLDALGYRDEVAAEILEIVDFRREIKAINGVITKVGTLYQGFKISAANAIRAMVEIGVSGEQAQALLTTWDQIRIAPVRLPSVSEIGAAVKYGTLDQATAMDALAELGYQPRDAAIVFSAYSEQQVTPLPPAGTGTTG